MLKKKGEKKREGEKEKKAVGNIQYTAAIIAAFFIVVVLALGCFRDGKKEKNVRKRKKKEK